MVFSQVPRECAAPAAEFHTVFRPLDHQKRRVFSCLGRDGSDGQACHVPGASWSSKAFQKGTEGLPFDVIF